MAEFKRSIAIVVGIDHYQNGIPPLKTAVADAHDISQVLRIDHGYQSGLLTDGQATLAVLRSLLTEKLPAYIQPDDRLVFYFAGHGLAFNGDEGPEGYLIPQDATLGKSDTYLPMTEVHDALTALSCRHFLGIFDCCFAGAFRWSATRDLSPVPEVIHRERYERFLTDPAWQVITSAADDQKALDALALTDHRGQVGQHSPFAQALIEALQANSVADSSPPAKNGQPAGDGVITATELYQYLRDAIEPETIEKAQRQTPGLWPLNKHGKGEFIFLVPGRQPNLPAAPLLNADSNPYRGLEAFEEIHQNLFFGRQQLIKDLQTFVETHPHTVVLGASGTGKSSLVKAGLVPALKRTLDISGQPLWQVLAVLRPGATPLKALVQALQASSLGLTLTSDTPEALALAFTTSLEQWRQINPQDKLLLVIDQTEELFSLCREPDQRQQFLQLLAQGQEQRSAWFHVVFTLRSDFEPQFRGMAMENLWSCDRFLIRPMNREELRAAIEAPASAKVIYFDPPDLVDRLIDEVNEMPGALPLLSFTLRELFLKYLRTASTRTSRAITMADYEELGGIKQALVNRADEEYQLLVTQDPAFADTIRRVMLRLVATGGTGNTRRQVLLSELEYPEPEADRVNQMIDRFKEARLLVSDTNADNQPYVEPAHDALVEGWPRLLQWLELGKNVKDLDDEASQKGWRRFFWNLRTNEDNTTLDEREKLLLQRRLTPAANDWQRKKTTKFLWHADARLPLLKQICKREPDWFNATEAEFVQRSLGRKQFNVRLRWVTILSIVAISIAGAFLGNWLRIRAVESEELAENNRIQAEKRNAQNLVSSSKTEFEADQHLDALLNALNATRVIQNNPTLAEDAETLSQATFALHRAFYGAREIQRLPSKASVLSPSGNYIATMDEIYLKVWSNQEQDYILAKEHGFDLKFHRFWFDYTEISFNPDETVILVANQEQEGPENPVSAMSWFLDGREADVHKSEILITKFSPNKNFVFTNEGLLRLSDRKQFKFYMYLHQRNLAFSTDAQKIALSLEGSVKVIDLNEIDREESFLEDLASRDAIFLDPEPYSMILGFTENDKYVFTLSHLGDLSDLRYKLWTLSGEELIVGDGSNYQPNCTDEFAGGNWPQLSPRGSFLFFTCPDGSIPILEFNLQQQESLEDEEIYNVRIHPRKTIDFFSFGNTNNSLSRVSVSQDESTWSIISPEGNKGFSTIWKLENNPVRFPKILDVGKNEILAFDISSNGSKAIAINSSGSVLFWDNLDSPPIEFIKPPVDYDLEILSEGQILGSAPENEITHLAIAKFANNRDWFVVGIGHKVHLLNYSGKILTSVEHKARIISVDFDSLNGNIISASEDGALKIWRSDGQIIREISLNKLITKVLFIPQENLVAIAYALERPPNISEFAINYDFSSDPGHIKLLTTDGIEILDFPASEAPFITNVDFLGDGSLLTSGMDSFLSGQQSSGQRGMQVFDIQDGNLKQNINVSGGTDLRHSSKHILDKLLIVDILEKGNGIDSSVEAFWHIDGGLLSDYSHLRKNLRLGNVSSDSYVGIKSGKFNSSGNTFAAKYSPYVDDSNSSQGKEQIAVWSFELSDLASKSCEYLSNYLSGPLATDAEKQLCSSDVIRVDSQTSETISGSPSSDSSQPPWYSPGRWLGQRQNNQLVISEENPEPAVQDESAAQGNSGETVEPSNPEAIATSLNAFLNLTGLPLPINEQVSFQRLNTQALAWDVAGALDSLNILQNSENQCVAAFAEQFTAILNQQGTEGFRQITPIKRELNAQQGCKLPLYPYSFSP